MIEQTTDDLQLLLINGLSQSAVVVGHGYVMLKDHISFFRGKRERERERKLWIGEKENHKREKRRRGQKVSESELEVGPYRRWGRV